MTTLTTTPDVGLRSRRFVPADFEASDAASLASLAETLLERSIESKEELEAWLHDWSELTVTVDAGTARRYIVMTCDTRDPDIKESFVSFERDIVPLWKKLDDRLNRRLLSCPYRQELGERYAVLLRRREKMAEIFREENTELKAQDVELAAQYDEIQGAVTVEIGDEVLTAQQCAARLENPDPGVREDAYRLLWERRLQDRTSINDVFDQLLELRERIGKNADFDNYRDFRFAELGRFDYTPADCEGYHRAVEKVIVPLVNERAEVRRQKLGLETLRPWDTVVNASGRPPVKPFEDADGYVRVTRDLFRAVDPVFDDQFDVLVRNDLLDLMSRPGKAPGGYNYPVEDIGLPFIFFNAVGVHQDVQTLLHEGGHAFHTLATRDEPLIEYREAPIEFAEVASMTMEMFGLDRIDTVYSEEDAREVRRSQLEGTLGDLCWFATIDAFQHWLYTHPGHDHDDRTQAWVEIFTRFSPHVDWSGIEEIRDTFWQKQSHLFGSPFYYIEYAIAQIGALQGWRNARADHAGSVAAYREALALGGSRPLPELFRTAGLKFAMDEEVLVDIGAMLIEEVRRLD